MVDVEVLGCLIYAQINAGPMLKGRGVLCVAFIMMILARLQVSKVGIRPWCFLLHGLRESSGGASKTRDDKGVELEKGLF